MAQRDLSKRAVAILLILAIVLSVVGTYLATRTVMTQRSVSAGTIQATVVEKDSGYSVSGAVITAQVVGVKRL